MYIYVFSFVFCKTIYIYMYYIYVYVFLPNHLLVVVPKEFYFNSIWTQMHD